jgi:hypothetical protein
MTGKKKYAVDRGIARIERLTLARESMENPSEKLLWVSQPMKKFKRKKSIASQMRENLVAEPVRPGLDLGRLCQPAQPPEVVPQDGPGLGLGQVEAEKLAQLGGGTAERVVAAEEQALRGQPLPHQGLIGTHKLFPLVAQPFQAVQKYPHRIESLCYQKLVNKPLRNCG